MPAPLARPSSTASFASSANSNGGGANSGDCNAAPKPRVLCLHGKFQSGAAFSTKIAGARRKLAREYTLDFLDGPILLPTEDDGDESGSDKGDASLAPRAWWHRSEDGKHTLVKEALEYVTQQCSVGEYEAIIGFSQGGTLATALALSGAFPNVRAVVTAGAPYVAEAFEAAKEICHETKNSSVDGLSVPKLHLAGETDAMVPVASTTELCELGGNGQLIMHEQGHLFPTRSARAKEVLEFLSTALSEEAR
ncbi:hypothetical protein ACHAXT_006313 [Thalassiosira profunda]